MVNLKEKKYLILFVVVSLATIFVDQISKILIAVKRPEWVLGFLSIHFVQNTGAGFGILKGQMALLAIISAVVVMGVIY
ncbi:signal peptidase II, partial [Candidatus Woesearchaeota archaeon]|nr:signal peptidase II [Candidatus Woesearchaeota archaeon]